MPTVGSISLSSLLWSGGFNGWPIVRADGGPERDRESDIVGPCAGGWLGTGPMSVSDGHMGIESQRLPGQALTGIGPDVVKPPRYT